MNAKTYKLSFDGFFSESSCRITIGIHNDLMIIVCSQRHNHTGTSITNAAEIIAAQLFRKLMQNEGFQNNKRFHSVTEYWNSLMKKNKPSLGAIYDKKKICWIEHYPVGTGILDVDQFTPIQFTAYNNPIWFPSIKAATAKERYGKDIITTAMTAKDEDENTL